MTNESFEQFCKRQRRRVRRRLKQETQSEQLVTHIELRGNTRHASGPQRPGAYIDKEWGSALLDRME